MSSRRSGHPVLFFIVALLVVLAIVNAPNESAETANDLGDIGWDMAQSVGTFFNQLVNQANQE